METLGASKKRKSDPDESVEEKRGKKRRGGSDTVQFLKEHSEMEFKFKREELEPKKSEQSFSTEQQKQQQQMISSNNYSKRTNNNNYNNSRCSNNFNRCKLCLWNLRSSKRSL